MTCLPGRMGEETPSHSVRLCFMRSFYETEQEKSEKIRDALSPSSSTHNNRDWGILLFHEKFHNL